jgi:hypothetical protein
MSDRDEGSEGRTRDRKAAKPHAVKNTTLGEEADNPASEEPKPARRTFSGPPRRPVQVVEVGKSFWVFCDDGTVCVARLKKGALRWWELDPPLPGSPADKMRDLSSEMAKAT